MADLIDRQELISCLSKDPLFPQVEAFGITNVIESRQSVDAEPVRHGRWIDDKIAFYRQCSECGANVRANLYEVFLDCDIRDLHYCPNCGAKMEE